VNNAGLATALKHMHQAHASAVQAVQAVQVVQQHLGLNVLRLTCLAQVKMPSTERGPVSTWSWFTMPHIDCGFGKYCDQFKGNVSGRSPQHMKLQGRAGQFCSLSDSPRHSHRHMTAVHAHAGCCTCMHCCINTLNKCHFLQQLPRSCCPASKLSVTLLLLLLLLLLLDLAAQLYCLVLRLSTRSGTACLLASPAAAASCSGTG